MIQVKVGKSTQTIIKKKNGRQNKSMVKINSDYKLCLPKYNFEKNYKKILL